MTDSQSLELLVSLKDIADLADKTPSAVSNWRRRYEDFPSPRIETASGALFDFGEVQTWLLATKRLSKPVPPEQILWNLANSLRNWLELSTISRFVIALLVYLEACERRGEFQIAEEDRWTEVGRSVESEVVARLIDAARRIEQANQELQSLMLPVLEVATEVPPQTVVTLVRMLEASVQNDVTRLDLFEEMLRWRDEYSRLSGEDHTRWPLAELMAQIAVTRGPKVLDPAVGQGLILRLMQQLPGEASKFIGFDSNQDALDLCRTACFFWRADVEVHLSDSLRDQDILEVQADVVVADPPYGVRGWSGPGASKDRRWNYGVPSPNSSDFAWLETVIMSLRPGGVGLVLLPKSSASVGGRDGMIRKAMLDDGAIAAMVLLPGRQRRNTSIPLVLWVVRRPIPDEIGFKGVLLIDATSLGRPGPDLHIFHQRELDWLAKSVNAFLDGSQLDEDVPFTQGVVDRGDFPGGDLLQAIARLKQGGTIDIDALRARRTELRSSVVRSTESSKVAITDLLSALEEWR